MLLQKQVKCKMSILRSTCKFFCIEDHGQVHKLTHYLMFQLQQLRKYRYFLSCCSWDDAMTGNIETGFNITVIIVAMPATKNTAINQNHRRTTSKYQKLTSRENRTTKIIKLHEQSINAVSTKSSYILQRKTRLPLFFALTLNYCTVLISNDRIMT